jgi:competence protein ComGF
MVIRKISAFTILETMVALVVIVTIFWIITMSLTKVFDSRNLTEQLEAHIAINKFAIETKSKGDFVSAQEQHTKFTLKRDFEYYRGDKHLLLMSISAINTQSKVIDFYREILRMDYEKN